MSTPFLSFFSFFSLILFPFFYVFNLVVMCWYLSIFFARKLYHFSSCLYPLYCFIIISYLCDFILPVFFVFNFFFFSLALYLLDLDGHRLLSRSYQQRRELLAELAVDGASPLVRVPPQYTDVDGRQLLEVARQHGLEGVVGKRLTSRYEPGRRSPAWTKTALLHTHHAGWMPWAGDLPHR